MAKMEELLRQVLTEAGAELVGFADLSGVAGGDLPFGVAIALSYPPAVIASIEDSPNAAYYQVSQELDKKAEALARLAADTLIQQGYCALLMDELAPDDPRKLPHKTVFTRAGLGWIGKSSLLVTRERGSALLLNSLLTDYPLVSAALPVLDYCNKCHRCVELCPAGAIGDNHWQLGAGGRDFFDADRCRETAKQRSQEAFGKAVPYCGRCMAVCPFTRKYLRKQS